MKPEQGGPRRWLPAAAQWGLVFPDYTNGGRTGQPADRFPRCDLFGLQLVDSLPRGCPLRAEWPLAIIERMQDLAFAELRFAPDGDLAEANDALARCETCADCVGRLLGHSKIRRLRPHREDAA